jgi:transglutaminase-like putative cysteine protease
MADDLTSTPDAHRPRGLLRTMPLIHHPGFGAVIRYEVTELPDDPAGQVAQTISLMGRYATEDASSPEITRDLQQALASGPGLPPEQAIFNYVKNRVRFVGDNVTASPFQVNTTIPIVETLVRPRDLSVMCSGGGQCSRAGDCDDFSMYGASLLLALGRDVRFVTVAADPSQPGIYSHVYVVVYREDGTRLPMDLSHGPYPGWEVQQVTRREEWSMNGGVNTVLVAGAILLGMNLWHKSQSRL